MKKVINKLKQRLLPKAGKANEHNSSTLSPSVAPSIAQTNRLREQQLAQCKHACEQLIQKLKNKEPLSNHDYVETMLAINALSDVRSKVD